MTEAGRRAHDAYAPSFTFRRNKLGLLGRGSPLLTESPRRRVLGNPYRGSCILIQCDRGKAYFLARLRSYEPSTLLHDWIDIHPLWGVLIRSSLAPRGVPYQP